MLVSENVVQNGRSTVTASVPSAASGQCSNVNVMVEFHATLNA
jgi:hypothetical protein